MVPLKLNKGRKSILRPRAERLGQGGKKMRKSVLIVILFLFFVSFISLNAQWARTYGGKHDDRARSIQQTSDGGYIVAGHTKSFGAGVKDFWVLKVNFYGEIEWQRTYGGIRSDEAWFIRQTSDGGYIVAGYTESFGVGWHDPWILKLDSNGNIEWQRTYVGEKYEEFWCIQQTSDGGYIMVGLNARMNIWISKLSSNGDIEWWRTGEADVWRGSNPNSIEQTSDGGYIVAGGIWCPDTWSRDFWVLKLNSNGEIEWQQAYGGGSYEHASSIQQTSNGGYIVAGFTESFGSGGADFWILKLDLNGDVEWQKTYGGNLDEYIWADSIRQTSDGGYIVGGNTESFGAGDDDAWILKIDSIGEIEWQRSYGGSDHDSAYSIQQTSDGGYIVGGNTESFGAGDDDAWILKLFPDGDIHSSCGFIESSNATVTDTFVFPEDTDITFQDTTATILDTAVFPQDSDATVTLLCECPKYNLTISATSGGTTDLEPDTYTYYEGEEVTIIATPDENYRFAEWTGDVPEGHETDSSITLTMNSDKSVTANFIRQWTLTIAAGQGGTTNPAPSTYVYDIGTEVQIEAISDENYRFTGWTGDATGTTNPITITMDSDKSVTANFEVIPEPPEPAEPEPEKGGCFIATAAYGSALHPHIDVLREFRDKYLMTNRLGRIFVKLYYRYSPSIAKPIDKSKPLKAVVRNALRPVIIFISLVVH